LLLNKTNNSCIWLSQLKDVNSINQHLQLTD
jgi:hypothetical protein